MKFLKVFYIWPKTKTIEDLFYYLDLFSVLLPISYIIYYWKKPYSASGVRIIFSYSILIFIINLLIAIYGDNKLFYTIYTGGEAFSFVFFLYVQLKNRLVKAAALSAGVAFILFIVLYALLTHERKDFDSVPIGIETLMILVFSFYYLYERMNDTTTLYIYSTFSFWIVIGMVLYLSGSFFIYIFAGFITKDMVNEFWFVTNIFSIFKNVLFTVGIIVNSTPPRKLMMPNYNFGSLN